MPNEEYTKLVKLDESQREALLNRMDRSEAMEGHGPMRKAVNRRHDKRWDYRDTDIAVVVEHPGGGVSRLLVCARNISAGGMSFLHGGFLHPGSRCRLTLRQTDGRNVPMSGKVVTCRHLERTIHEIGLQFEKRIDPRQFIKYECTDHCKALGSLSLTTLHGCVLYVDDSTADQNLMRFYMESCGAQVQMATNGIEGIALAEQGKFIAVITELALPGLSGTELAQALRSAGFKTPIIAVTPDERAETKQQAIAGGCNAVLVKPLDFAQLTTLLKRLVPAKVVTRNAADPIFSTQWNDTRLRPLIVTFLEGLEREIQHLCDHVTSGDGEALRRVSMSLKGSAGGYGFPQISAAAQDVLKAMEPALETDSIRGKVDALIALCQNACRAPHSAPANNQPT
jgi:CheY-like chemotaxis protein